MTEASKLLSRDGDQYSYTTQSGEQITGPVSFCFLASLQENNPELYNKIPNLFKQQLTEQAYDRPFLDAAIMQQNLIRAVLDDPLLTNTEDVPEYFDDDYYLAFASNNSDDKYQELTRDIPKHTTKFRGVLFRVKLTGIMDLQTGELVPQDSSKKGVLPPGQGWVSGMRSNQLRLTEDSVAQGLLSQADYRALHYYAVYKHVLDHAEGERSLYQPMHTKSRIWFTPEGPDARIEFDFVSRNRPGSLEEAVGLQDIGWAHVKGLGVFCGANSQVTGVTTPKATRAATPRSLPSRAAAAPASATMSSKREKSASVF